MESLVKITFTMLKVYIILIEFVGLLYRSYFE